ncbi:MAG: hypothetical protein WAV18_27280 [Roseiarcus sp.]
MKKALVLVAFLTALFPLSALAQSNTLVVFDGGIGVIPVSSAVGAGPTSPIVNLNIVRGVQPAPQIWVIRDLAASVKTNGTIHVVGLGLLLGGGNGIGSNANASVFATLFCGATAQSTNPAGVPLQPDGDFLINDVLSPAPPNPCVSPVLLIRVTGAGLWFAAGIPRQ